MKPPVSVSHSRRQALPSSHSARQDLLPLSGDDVLSMVAMTGRCASADHGRPFVDRDCGGRTAVAVDAAPFGAALLCSECGPGPSRTRSTELCEAKAEAVRHGIARAMALAAAPFSNCGPGPSASTRNAYCREGKAEAGRQGVAGAVALGAAPFGASSSLIGPADTRLQRTQRLRVSLIKIVRRWLPWAQ